MTLNSAPITPSSYRTPTPAHITPSDCSSLPPAHISPRQAPVMQRALRSVAYKSTPQVGESNPRPFHRGRYRRVGAQRRPMARVYMVKEFKQSATAYKVAMSLNGGSWDIWVCGGVEVIFIQRMDVIFFVLLFFEMLMMLFQCQRWTTTLHVCHDPLTSYNLFIPSAPLHPNSLPFSHALPAPFSQGPCSDTPLPPPPPSAGTS